MTRLFFVSSIAVASHFPLLHPYGPFEVPEEMLSADYTAEFGYPEAKWVCESLLECVGPLLQGTVHASIVRLGQLTGAEGAGAWNVEEHVPLVIRASRAVKALPMLFGVRPLSSFYRTEYD
jgi:thioester reductase-like protein